MFRGKVQIVRIFFTMLVVDRLPNVSRNKAVR